MNRDELLQIRERYAPLDGPEFVGSTHPFRVCGTCNGSGWEEIGQYAAEDERGRMEMVPQEQACPDCVEGIQPQGEWTIRWRCGPTQSLWHGEQECFHVFSEAEHEGCGWVAVVPVNLEDT